MQILKKFKIVTQVRNLKLAKDLPLVQFLPAIMNQLLFILQNYDRSRTSQQGELVRESYDLAAEAFDAVAHLVKTAQVCHLFHFSLKQSKLSITVQVAHYVQCDPASRPQSDAMYAITVYGTSAVRL